MDKIKLFLSCIFVSLVVALTYYGFEYSIHSSITYIWDTTFSTGNTRWLVVPLSVVGALLFFGLQHFFDPKSENHESHSLGGDPIKPTLRNLATILVIGYFSLVGGASLGPEAVLVPACTVIGSYAGVKLFRHNKEAAQALAAAAVMALMTSFFHSYLVGILSVVLVAKLAKTNITAQLLAIAVISSVPAYLLLDAIDPQQSYFNFPHFTWKIIAIDIVVGAALLAAGYAATFALKYAHQFFVALRSRYKVSKWWLLAITAGLGLSVLYLIGGPLVEFTGNESIAPLVHQASDLGVSGVAAILVIKILAIGWSKAVGYRGGLIFPMVFVASSLVAIAQLVVSDASFGVGMIAALVGILAAESKAHILL